jgi:hypothetical protein
MEERGWKREEEGERRERLVVVKGYSNLRITYTENK